MRNATVAAFTAAIVSFLLLTASRASDENDSPPIRYASPTAVFDAYREARGKGDWRKVFSLLSPEGQKDALFGALFGLGERGSEEDRAIERKYLPDEATVVETVKNEYKAKHGVYPDDATLKTLLDKEYGAGDAKPNADGGAESQDSIEKKGREVLDNFLAKHVKDKVGLFEAAFKQFGKRLAVTIGDLQELKLEGEVATARVKMTVVHRFGPTSMYDSGFRFTKIDGGWLIAYQP